MDKRRNTTPKRPLKAVRSKCSECANNQPHEIKECSVLDCPLYPLRFGRRKKGYLVLKAIKKRCLDCGEGTAQAVRKCKFPDCPLYRFRLGKNPARKGMGNKNLIPPQLCNLA